MRYNYVDIYYWSWSPLWYLQDIMMSVLLRFTDPDHPFDIFKTLWCLFFFDIRILITQLYLQDIVLSAESVIRWRTDNTMSWRYNWVIRIRISKKNRHHNVFKISKGWSGSVNRRRTDNRILITPLVSSDIMLSVLLWNTDSDYPFVSSRHFVVYSFLIYGFWFPLWYLQDSILSALLWNTDSDYPFGIHHNVLKIQRGNQNP
jgi:hypothetical protein